MNKIISMSKVWFMCLLLLSSGLAAATEERLAYLAYTDGYWQVWVKSADQPKQITFSAYDKIRISWYPDGQHLLLNGQQGELAQLDIRSGKETTITAPFENITDAMISPNGQQLVFSINTADSKDGNNLWLYTLAKQSTLSKQVPSEKSQADKNLLRLTKLPYLQHQPVWAPDGQSLYFLSSTSLQNHDIWQYQFAEKKLEKLTADKSLYFDIAVSKNNDLLFSRREGQQFDLWVWPYPHAQQGARALITSPAFEGQPAWGEQGIYFVSDRSQAKKNNNALNIFYCQLPCTNPEVVMQHEQGARAPVVWFK